VIFVPVGDVRQGDRLSQNVYRADGRLVLAQGAILTPQLIEGLIRLRIEGVYIDNAHIGGEAAADGILDEGVAIRQNALKVAAEVFADIAAKGDFHSRSVIRLTDDLVHQLNKNEDVQIQMKEFRTNSSYLIAHSVNVCVLAVLTAKALGYSEQHLRTVAIGALLHDIGYAAGETEDPAHDHPRIGFDIIRKHPDIPLLSAHIVLQHHERLDGTGYPMAIGGEEFRQAAQICAIANDFDHFVNEIGQKRLPHEGIEYVMSKVDSCYDIAVVRAFVQSVTPYPVGTVVKLTNGIVGTVTELHKGYPSRPVIVTRDQGLRFDLMHFHTEFVEEVLVREHGAAV